MNSGQITPEQAKRLKESVRRWLAYLGKLRRRMEVLGFPPGDALYQSVARAHDAAQELHVRAHYCGCRGGVGRGK